jgi:hydroxymethylbilane synthase
MNDVRPSLRLGTRGSRLALVQTGLVAARLREGGAVVETVIIETDGDRRAADTAWGEGAFVTAIEAALLAGQVDVAVHSAKDVPTDEDPRLTIAAFLPRERPEDVLVVRAGEDVRDLADLPVGARVGTDSPRRTAFLRALRPDLRVHPLHGNVDTRLRRLDHGETDALVLAGAGLRRLGAADRIAAWLPPAMVPPAPGQGALAVQVRAGDPAAAAVAALDDLDTRRAVLAERRLLAAAGGGCRSPLGAWAAVDDEELRILAGIATPDGSVTARVAMRLRDDAIGPVLVALAAGTAARAAELGRPRVVVTRDVARAAPTVLALVDRGFAPVVVPTIETRPSIDDPWARASLADALRAADWIVVTSATVVPVLQEVMETCREGLGGLRARWAAIGQETERVLGAAGVPVAYRPEQATGRDLAAGIPAKPGERVLVPRGDRADPALITALAERGAIVEPRVVYSTLVAPVTSRDAMAAALVEPGPVAVLAASPSAVEGWLRLARSLDLEDAARSVPVLAIGPTTAAAVARSGLRLLDPPSSPEPGPLSDALDAAIPTRSIDPRATPEDPS